jgi:serine protease Do
MNSSGLKSKVVTSHSTPKVVCVAIVFLFLAAAPLYAQDRETKVRSDRENVETDGYWIYNNLKVGYGDAKESGKPLLVVFRCIPCEACAQLDSEVVERDEKVRALLDQFVCVRVVHANGLDLSRFQFDYDQSWAAFMLNADGTIYGRYGTRSHQTESENDVSLQGFAKALEKALELHGDYPAVKKSLAAKTGAKAPFESPEEMPSLAGKYTSKLDWEGKVVGSCIHCHQVGEAQRLVYRQKGAPIPEKVLFPYPHPKSLGLILDPQQAATVKAIEERSPAERDGFRAGDEIVSLAGQPLISIADFQWVLQEAPATGPLPAKVLRDGKQVELTLSLAEGWRRRGDISWRATSWDLRRMTTGGMWLEELSDEERFQMKLPHDKLALKARHVGKYGEHAAAHNAGFRDGDLLVSIDGDETRITESELMTRLVNEKQPGQKITAEVVRDGKRLKLNWPIQ